MAKDSLTITLRIEGVRETLDALNQLPKQANDELKDRAGEVARLLADRAQASARAESRQAALMAPTIKVRRDRLPKVIAGGTKRVGRHRVEAFQVLFGSEFGSNHLKQFKPHNADGYWFFPVVRRNASDLADAWDEAATEIIRRFTAGGA